MAENLSSFIVTGASASGKSTLVRRAYTEGYNTLPTHTTRQLRFGEVDGVDMVSVAVEKFKENFRNGEYLEPSLDFALLNATGIYYGTPQAWIGRLGSERVCAMPTSLTVARKIRESVDAPWVHLECPPEIRKQRLTERGISDSEVVARLTAGESLVIPEEADIVVDSSVISAVGILKVIHKEFGNE
jgi:guanylate kinase